ncbi:MAG: hypothetical protein PHO57_07265 [Acidithiobacillus sp.]|nr:hypothetical protein [Acidithiobacillus sp.]
MAEESGDDVWQLSQATERGQDQELEVVLTLEDLPADLFLHMAPDQLIRVGVGCIRGQVEELQSTLLDSDEVTDQFGLVDGVAVYNEEHWGAAGG